MKNELLRRIIEHKYFYLMILPGFVLVFMFSYMAQGGLYMAFVDYKPQLGNFWPSLFESKFVGFEWFRYFFAGQDFLRVMRNTLASSMLSLAFGSVAPIFFAVMLNECRIEIVKRVVQTTSYLPYFISWVTAVSIIITLLSSTGVVNQILLGLGLVNESVLFLQDGKYFWGIVSLSNVWKDMGYNTIMYLAAITSISQEMFEAAQVDGAGRLKQIWHILLPSLLPTIVILLILNIGSLLNTGFDQYFLLGNNATRDYSDVLDTYTFRYGIQNGAYSYATAVSLFKSLVAFTMVASVNKVAKTLKTSHLF